MVIGNYRYSLELEFSANTTVGLFPIPHRSQLMILT